MSQASRNGIGIPGSSNRRRANVQPMTCNKCRKPLSTTIFVVACNCVFCEECTYSHFQASPNCPCCNTVLSESDFSELVLADPTASNSNADLQRMFTKPSPKSKTMALQDACANIMRQEDNLRNSKKILMKQCFMENSRQSARAVQCMRLIEKLRQENLALKQAQNSQKLKHEQTIEKLRQQNHSLQQKLAERDEQVMQFRRIHGSNGRKEPSSTHGPRRVSDAGMSHQGSVQGPPQPPIQGYMVQREAQERAKQRQLETPQRGRPIMGSAHSHTNGGYNSNPRMQTPQRRYSGDSSISPGGIRNITASTGFAFSGGQRRMRSGGSSGASPSQAFLSNPSGAYSRSQSPSSAFQNQSYPRRQY